MSGLAEARRGKPRELHREEEDQQGAEREIRKRDPHKRQQRRCSIPHAPVMPSRRHPQRDRDRHGHQERRDGQLQRRRVAREDFLGDGSPIHERHAEIAPHDVPPVCHVLLQQRPIQPEAVAHLCDLLGRRRLPEERQDRISRDQVQQQEDERHDGPNDRNDEHQATEEYPHDPLHAPALHAAKSAVCARRLRREFSVWIAIIGLPP
ncbi:hypothetical protein HRbin10_02630 [bacterium HR10]|nr:hypothetical protein HRbin10_02630 [bacterium HR10]